MSLRRGYRVAVSAMLISHLCWVAAGADLPRTGEERGQLVDTILRYNRALKPLQVFAKTHRLRATWVTEPVEEHSAAGLAKLPLSELRQILGTHEGLMHEAFDFFLAVFRSSRKSVEASARQALRAPGWPGLKISKNAQNLADLRRRLWKLPRERFGDSNVVFLGMLSASIRSGQQGQEDIGYLLLAYVARFAVAFGRHLKAPERRLCEEYRDASMKAPAWVAPLRQVIAYGLARDSGDLTSRVDGVRRKARAFASLQAQGNDGRVMGILAGGGFTTYVDNPRRWEALRLATAYRDHKRFEQARKLLLLAREHSKTEEEIRMVEEYLRDLEIWESLHRADRGGQPE